MRQETGTAAASENANVRMKVGRKGWGVVRHAENGGVQSEASKRVPVADIHDCGAISGGDRPVGLHCCCVSRVAHENTDALVEEPRACRRLAARRRG